MVKRPGTIAIRRRTFNLEEAEAYARAIGAPSVRAAFYDPGQSDAGASAALLAYAQSDVAGRITIPETQPGNIAAKRQWLDQYRAEQQSQQLARLLEFTRQLNIVPEDAALDLSSVQPQSVNVQDPDAGAKAEALAHFGDAAERFGKSTIEGLGIPLSAEAWLQKLQDSPPGQMLQTLTALGRGDLGEAYFHSLLILPTPNALWQLGKPQYDELSKAYAAYRQHAQTESGLAALAHPDVLWHLATGLQLYGPAAEKVRQQIEQGNYAGAAGTVLSVAVSLYGPKALGRLGRAGAENVAFVPDALEPLNSEQAYQPTTAGTSASPSTLPDANPGPNVQIAPPDSSVGSTEVTRSANLETGSSDARLRPNSAGPDNVGQDAKPSRHGTGSAEPLASSRAAPTQPINKILEEIATGKDYTTRVPGRHHLGPRALGNGLPYGDAALTLLDSWKHTIIQGELESHLRTITKELPDGKVVDMLPRRGNSGQTVRANFTTAERIQALDQFYRTFARGRYYQAFRMELNAARKRGVFE